MYKSVYQWQSATKSDYRLLHVGCGTKYWTDWANIDAYPAEKTDTHRGEPQTQINPDIWADIMNIPVEIGTVDAIASHHVLEHFYRHQVIDIVKYFYDLLKPGGFLITEMPDLSRILLLIRLLPFRPKYKSSMKANRDVILAQLYGASWEVNDKGYPYHKYVWMRKEFCEMLSSVGFSVVINTGSTASHVPFRDMAVIAQKPYYNQCSQQNLAISPVISDLLNQYTNPQFRAIRQLKSILNILRNSFAR